MHIYFKLNSESLVITLNLILHHSARFRAQNQAPIISDDSANNLLQENELRH